MGSVPGHAVGRLGRAGSSGARDGVRHGTAAAVAPAEPQRDAGRRAVPDLQGGGRQRPAAARPQGPARGPPVRRRQRRAVQDAVRQRVDGVGRRDPARPAADRGAGRRAVLRRADARHPGPDADLGRPRRREHPRRRQADEQPAAVRELPAVAAVGAVREPAGGRRPRQAQARVLLRRGAPALQRRAGRRWSRRSSRWCG